MENQGTGCSPAPAHSWCPTGKQWPPWSGRRTAKPEIDFYEGNAPADLVVTDLAIGTGAEAKPGDKVDALGEWWRVLRRELITGSALGLILGLVGFGRIAIWQSITPIYGEHWVLVAVTVGVALVGIVLWGSLAGSMLPLLLKKMGLDPATSSAPFVATLVDVTGLIIYFSVALLILRGTLL